MLKNFLIKSDIAYFLIIFIFFYSIFGYALDYQSTYDDFLLLNQFLTSPGDAKLYSSYFYAEFHFYPIYFLSHELDKLITFIYSTFIDRIEFTYVQKSTNFILHIFNAFLVFIILKIYFSPKNIIEKLLLFFSSLIFLFHPISSQVVFNVTTRNESLSLFFSLLTLIFSFRFFENKKIINSIFVFFLYFFALSSKLSAVTFIAIIPCSILLIKYENIFNYKNIAKILPLTLILISTFIFFYFIRDNFVNDYLLSFYNDFFNISKNIVNGLKFYLRGLFFPIEHIYIYADNYNQNYQYLILFIFILITLISISIFFKKKDPYPLIIIIWLSSTLSMPIFFNLIESGFPLISKLAERYQYSSIPALSILSAWILFKFKNKKFLKYVSTGLVTLIIIFFAFIKIDRSLVYENNRVFFYKAHENSPSNYHEYFFTVPLQDAVVERNPSKYLFNLYQLYNLYPNDINFFIEFMSYYKINENDIGYQYFFKKFQDLADRNLRIKYRLAEHLYRTGDYELSEKTIISIFKDIDVLIEKYSKKNKKIVLTNPEIDDIYFLNGLVLYKLNKSEDSLGNFMLATLHNPMHATALFNSSLILKELGQLELAKRHYEDALKINPFLRETVNNMLLD